MSRSDRDPLFFPPQKYGEENEPEGYSVDVDTASQEKKLKALVILAVSALVAVLLGLKAANVRTVWAELKTSIATAAGHPPENAPLDSIPAQLQAQRLLQRAAAGDASAVAEIHRRLPNWKGKLELDDPLWSALAAASEAKDQAARGAAVEVDLVARHIEQTPEMVDRLIGLAAPGQNNRPAALWGLGELANRGVEPDRARQAVLSYLHDPQEDVRYWAVSALAQTGQDAAIAPLLEVLRNDSSGKVRENAARGLAVGGMFEKAERMQAVPELIQIAGDRRLEASTQQWAMHALRDITGQSFGDAAGWQKWYAQQSHS